MCDPRGPLAMLIPQVEQTIMGQFQQQGLPPEDAKAGARLTFSAIPGGGDPPIDWIPGGSEVTAAPVEVAVPSGGLSALRDYTPLSHEQLRNYGRGGEQQMWTNISMDDPLA